MVVDLVLPSGRCFWRVARVHSFEDAQTSKVFQGQLESSKDRAARHVGAVDAALPLLRDFAEAG